VTSRRGRGPAAPPPGGPRSTSSRAQTGRSRAPAPRGSKVPPPRRRRSVPPARRPPRRRVTRRDPIKRLNVGLLLVAFVLSLFAGRLVQLQGIESKGYAQAAVQQRLSRIDLPAIRGPITFAEGQPLAMTVDARVVYADPVMVAPAQRQQIATSLGSMFGLDPGELMRKLVPGPGQNRYVELVHHVEPDRARMVTAMEFKGIGTLREYRRVYPGGDLAANVAGFVNGDGDGGAGLESGMNSLLKGRNGWQKVELGESGQRIPMGEDEQRKPVPGRGVRLTLDRDIQWAAQRAVARQVKATGAQSGSVVVMDPRNGRVLAMAGAPTFDPENYGRAKLADLGNRVVQEGFEPGSTSKVITAAAAMEAGGVTPGTVFRVPDHVRRYDRVFHDAESHGVEHLTFGGVLARSSNVGTILASERVKPARLYQYMRAFGYGDKTGVGLPGESPGLLKPVNQWWGTDRYTVAFGQSVSVNALQTASVYSTIANGGVRVAPNVIAGITDDKGGFRPSEPPATRRVISTGTADALVRMLEGVTTKDGTAPSAQIPGYRVAGKTGTAQKVNPRCGCYVGGGYTSTFVGFAPADRPQLVVEVVLQKPRRGHYGGQVAAPVFKDVMSFALQSRRIPPTGSRSQKIRITADPR
jgi:cell division protein FtsI (penicillin-binding protein 3)